MVCCNSVAIVIIREQAIITLSKGFFTTLNSLSFWLDKTMSIKVTSFYPFPRPKRWEDIV